MVYASRDVYAPGQVRAAFSQAQILAASLYAAVRVNREIAQMHLVDDGFADGKSRAFSHGRFIVHHDSAAIVPGDGFGIRIEQLAQWVEARISACGSVGVIRALPITVELRIPSAVVVFDKLDSRGLAAS